MPHHQLTLPHHILKNPNRHLSVFQFHPYECDNDPTSLCYSANPRLSRKPQNKRNTCSKGSQILQEGGVTNRRRVTQIPLSTAFQSFPMLSQLWESSTITVFREREKAHITLRHLLLYLLLHSATSLSDPASRTNLSYPYRTHLSFLALRSMIP